jgi:hypothetical protein
MDNQDPKIFSTDNFGSDISPKTPKWGEGMPVSSSDQNAPPPPPSTEQQVGIRSMSSDIESIRQSGGEAPQSQIVSAPELGKPSPVAQQTASTESKKQEYMQGSFYPRQFEEAEQNVSGQIQEKKPFNIKIVLISVAVLVAAIIVGYAAYSLVSSLNQQQPATGNTNTGNGLPVYNQGQQATGETQANVNQNQSTTTQQETNIQQFSHVSVIPNPNESKKLILNDTTLTGFKAAMSISASSKLYSGKIRDLEFDMANGTPIRSGDFLSTFLPQIASNLISFVEDDFSSWLYFDTTSFPKFGTIFKLKPLVSFDQVTSTLSSIIESALSDIPNLFISAVEVPEVIKFDDGLIEKENVRFIVFSTASKSVFEYVVVQKTSGNYLIMADSYLQMVDIMKRLK